MRKLVLVVVLCMAVFVAAGCGENVTEKEITEDFYAAYDFWNSWVYGLSYCDYALDNPPVGPYVSVIKENCPIGSCEELEKEIRSLFSKELSDRMLDYLKPFEKDGRLCAYGVDVGGSAVEFENIVIEKINDEKYSVKFDTRTFYDVEYENQVISHEVYYVSEGGKWVFENGEEEFFFVRKLPGYLKKEYAPYNEVLRNYYAALWQRWDEERRAENNLTDVIRYYDDENRLKDFGFCLFDVDADGQKELLIGEMKYDSETVYDFYTVKDGKAKQVALGWERCRFYIYEEDGEYKIIRHGSSGASLISDDHYILENGELKHMWSVVMDGIASPENPWFLADDDNFDVTDDTPIDKDEYDLLANGYREKSMKLEYIPFSTLGSEWN